MGNEVSSRRDGDDDFTVTIAHPQGTESTVKTSFQKDTKLLERTHCNMEFKLLQHKFKSFCRSCFADAAMRTVVSEYSDHLYLTLPECKELFFDKSDLNEQESFILEHIFKSLNMNNDAVLSFGEYVVGVSIASRGTISEKLSGSFALYDVQKTGILDRESVQKLIIHLLETKTLYHDDLRTPTLNRPVSTLLVNSQGVPSQVVLPLNNDLPGAATTTSVQPDGSVVTTTTTVINPVQVQQPHNVVVHPEQMVVLSGAAVDGVAPFPVDSIRPTSGLIDSAPSLVEQSFRSSDGPFNIVVNDVALPTEMVVSENNVVTITGPGPQVVNLMPQEELVVIQDPSLNVVSNIVPEVIPQPEALVVQTHPTEQDIALYKQNKPSLVTRIASELVEELFGNQQTTLTRDQFDAVCSLDDRWIGCFGMFERFFESHLESITQFLSSNNPYERQGYMKSNGPKPTFHEVKGGVLIRYKDETRESEEAESLDLRSCLGVEDVFSDQTGFTIVIDKQSRRYYVAESRQEKQQWMYCILLYILASTDNRYHSYSPVRPDTRMRWYVDGKETFAAMAKAMYNATEEIFIAGWAVTPLYYMLRGPHPSTDDFRLDVILKHKAAQGVRIYVMVWKETTLAGLLLETTKVKHYLKSLYPRNIYVCTHPKKFPLEWTHHQKMVVVDQEIAFVGGLDICYGRWDDFEHRITDTNHCAMTWPGNDYTCTWVQGFLRFDQKLDAFRDPIDREYHPRQAWHDVHCSMEGEIVQDVCTNFIERWNHHTRTQDSSNRLVVKMPDRFATGAQDIKFWGKWKKHFDDRKGRREAEKQERRNKKKNNAAHTPFKSTLFEIGSKLQKQFEAPGMHGGHRGPQNASHDLEMYRSYDSRAGNAPSFDTNDKDKIKKGMDNILRKAKLKKSEQVDQDELSNPIMSRTRTFGSNSHSQTLSISEVMRSQQDPRDQMYRTQSLIRNQPTNKYVDGTISNTEQERRNYIKSQWYRQGQEEGFVCDVQVCRSISKWSGSTATEQSIYSAYLDIISKAKHYLYIENQYFIGSTAGGQVRNMVPQMILNRLISAIRAKECFRVIVVLPVLPDGDPTDASIQQVVKWQYRTIINNRGSILNTLTEMFPGVDLSEYVTFNCIRSHGMLNNEFYLQDNEEAHEAAKEAEKSKGRTNLNNLVDLKKDKDAIEDEEEENRDALNKTSVKRLFTDTGKRVVTEQIYVHSKLLIADDRICIIGSANINDRSMLGSRDSEIAVVIEDKEFVPGKMNGQPYKAGKFALSLRLRLWKEHLGLMKKKHASWDVDPTEFEETSGHSMLNKDNPANPTKLDKEMNHARRKQTKKAILDPIAESTFKHIWVTTAIHNTQIYENVFPHIVSNKYDTMEKYLEERDKYNPVLELERKKRREEIEKARYKMYKMVAANKNATEESSFSQSLPVTGAVDVVPVQNDLEVVAATREPLDGSKPTDKQLLDQFGQHTEAKVSLSSADFRKEQMNKRLELTKLRGNLVMYPLQFAKSDVFKKTISLNLVDDNIFT
ncbi:phospholipase D [Acrasis kona]|uniref:phospholipase D n=1 Tax=Acrasis kona TaxID=1008807 RepID=A0AAW2Z0K9_9EUKA